MFRSVYERQRKRTNLINGAVNRISILSTSSRQGSGESVHMHRLHRAFDVCTHEVWM